LSAAIIAGCANNQLAQEQIHGQMITEKGILYCPDYVINAGGLINVYNEMIGYNEEKAFQQLHNIYDTLTEIFARAKHQEITTNEAAKQLAEERIRNARKIKNKEMIFS
jgi:leucine dehydrogenase